MKSLEELVVHPEVFSGNYNKIIGSYIINEGSNAEYENKHGEYLKKKEEMDAAIAENDEQKIMELMRELATLDDYKEEKAGIKKNAISSEAFSPTNMNNLLEALKKIGINDVSIIDEITNYRDNPESNTWDKSIIMGERLEDYLLSSLFGIKKYKMSLLKSVVKNNNYEFLKENINFGTETSYRNFRTKRFKKAYPVIYGSAFRTTAYEAIRDKKMEVMLPKWFTDSYTVLSDFLGKKDEGYAFTINDLKEAINNDSANKYLYKSVNSLIELGIVEKSGKKGRCNEYVLVNKPCSFYKIDNDVKKAVEILNWSKNVFQEGYAKLTRDGFLKKEVIAEIEKYLEEKNGGNDYLDFLHLIDARYQNFCSAILRTSASFHTIKEKEELDNGLFKKIGETLEALESNPKKAYEGLERYYSVYSHKIRSI